MSRPAALLLGRSPSTNRLIRSFEAQGFESVHDSNPEDLGQSFERFKLKCEQNGWIPSCVHPGLHGWADRTEFPVRVLEQGWTPISPSPGLISLFTQRLALLLKAERYGVPHLLLDDEPRSSLAEIISWADDRKVDYPFVLKSLRSTSGLGVFIAHSREDLKLRLPHWLKQLKESFGEVLLYSERYLEAARRILVPFARYSDGRIQTFARVECSLQSRFRNLIDFCPATHMGQSVDRRLVRWTEELSERTRYVGVGLLEYFVEGDDVYLDSGMPRLNLGFHLWEAVSGTRALDWQLDTLDVRGRALKPELRVPALSSGLCARWFAEDSKSGLPSPGWMHGLKIETELSHSEGYVDTDLAIPESAEIPPPEDGLLGVLTAVARTRGQAMRLSRETLQSWNWLGTVRTNRRLLIEVMDHPFVRDDHYHSGFMDEDFAPSLMPPLGVMLQAFKVSERLLGCEATDLWWCEGRRLEVKKMQALPEYAALSSEAERVSTPFGEVYVSGELSFTRLEGSRIEVRAGAWEFSLKRVTAELQAQALSGPRRLLSQTSGVMHAQVVREGTWVSPHQPLCVVESLKRLIPHAVPKGARVIKFFKGPGEKVVAGEVIAEIEVVDEPPPA